MMRKLLTVAGIVFVVFFVANNPATAAGAVRSVGAKLAEMGSGFGDFFAHLVS